MECGAKRVNGERCRTQAMPNGRCRIHGGKSLNGLAHPSTTHGRYSKHLPTRYLARYNEARDDARLLEFRDDLALLDARLCDVMEQVGNSESGELWKRCKEALRSHDKAKEEEARKEAFGQIRWLINEGYAEWQTWMEIRRLLEDRRKIVEAEVERQHKERRSIDEKGMLLVLGAVSQIIRTHVADADALRRIARDFAGLVSSPASGTDRPGQAASVPAIEGAGQSE